MAKISIDITPFEIVERDFPEACKFCPEDDCSESNCPFLEDRLALEAELLLLEEPTLEKYELLQNTYKGRKE